MSEKTDRERALDYIAFLEATLKHPVSPEEALIHVPSMAAAPGVREAVENGLYQLSDDRVTAWAYEEAERASGGGSYDYC